MSEEFKIGDGKRLNKGKIELSLCPVSAQAAIAHVLMKNSKKFGGKYAHNNWRQGMSFSTVINCLERHLADYKAGIDIDQEDGERTIWKILTNAAFLTEYEFTCPELDDRFKYKQASLHDFPKIEPKE